MARAVLYELEQNDDQQQSSAGELQGEAS